MQEKKRMQKRGRNRMQMRERRRRRKGRGRGYGRGITSKPIGTRQYTQFSSSKFRRRGCLMLMTPKYALV